MKKHYAISLDEFVEELYPRWGAADESPAGHYVVFSGSSKDEALEKFVASIRPIIKQMMYVSDNYGLEDEDEATR